MKKFKIVLMFIAMFMMVGTLSSCASKPKEFSSNGITITLTNKFKYGNDENVQVLLLTSADPCRLRCTCGWPQQIPAGSQC